MPGVAKSRVMPQDAPSLPCAGSHDADAVHAIADTDSRVAAVGRESADGLANLVA